jgi:hypothetical protein
VLRTQVRGYADAIGRVAFGRKAVDIGSGPHCLLARLTVNAGASRVDAIEQNDSFVSHAMETFAAEAAGETTHASVTSLRACAGAAALGPLFDVTVAHANPPPASRATEVKTRAEGAAAAGVEAATPTDTGEVRCKVALQMKGTGAGAGGSSSSDGEDMDEEGSSGSEEEEEEEEEGEGGEAGYNYEEEEDEEEDGCSSLYLHHGYSTVCSSLRGDYNLVVHEILGHVRTPALIEPHCVLILSHARADTQAGRQISGRAQAQMQSSKLYCQPNVMLRPCCKPTNQTNERAQVASSEGAVGALADLHERGLIDAAATGDAKYVKIIFLSHFLLLELIVLPRQARDKHRESTQNKTVLSGSSRPPPARCSHPPPP